SSVARMRMVVVLPAPLGPMKPYTSPFSSLSVSRFRAYRSPYILVRSRVSIIGSILGALHGDEDADVGFLVELALERRAGDAGGGQGAEPEPAAGGRLAVDRVGLAALRDEAGEQDRLVVLAVEPLRLVEQP